MKHYLITLNVPAVSGHLHSYLATNDKSDIERVADRMAKEAERYGPVIPLILCTELSSGRELVRGIVRKISDKLDTAKDFHLTMWMFPEDHPDDAPLMALH